MPQTLHEWVKKSELDSGAREGVTSDEREHIKALERENKELRRANEILKLASAFSPRRSRAANSSSDRIRRPAARYLRGRADLQSAANRPVWLPSPCCPATHTRTALCAGQTGCNPAAADSPGLAIQYAGLRCRQSLAPVEPRRRCHGPLYSEAPHAALRPAGGGARLGNLVRTTVSGKAVPCPLDRVNRQFKADWPNELWVSDFTYVSTCQGWQYVGLRD